MGLVLAAAMKDEDCRALEAQLEFLSAEVARLRLEFRSAKLAGRWLIGLLATAAALFSALR